MASTTGFEPGSLVGDECSHHCATLAPLKFVIYEFKICNFEFEKTASKLEKEKEKENLCVVLTYSMKRASEIRKLHVVVVQQRLFFFQTKPIAFFLLQKLPIVVIQKFCHRSNVTSHFTRLLEGE